MPEDSMMKEEVGPEEISTIVSKWTGIPVNKLQEEDRERLLKLKEELHQKVVGQDEACTVVANAVLRSRYAYLLTWRLLGEAASTTLHQWFLFHFKCDGLIIKGSLCCLSLSEE